MELNVGTHNCAVRSTVKNWRIISIYALKCVRKRFFLQNVPTQILGQIESRPHFTKIKTLSYR